MEIVMPNEKLKATKEKEAPTKAEVLEYQYVTREKEPMFLVRYPGGGWRPSLLGDGRQHWTIPADEKDRFEAHHHFQIGRIIPYHG
jgi:hypothetical protein